MRDSAKAIEKYDVAYFTASCDTVEVNTKFAKSLKLKYPILSDPDKKVAEAYGVVTEERKFPHRWTIYIGPDSKIKHIDKKVNARQHGTDIVKTLKELKVPEKKDDKKSD